MEVCDVMTAGAVACREDETLGDAVRRMVEAGVSALPVLAADGSGAVVGMLTHRSVLRAAVAEPGGPDRLGVGAVMSAPARCCWWDDSVESAEAIMRAYRVRRLPVVDAAGCLRGLVTLTDAAAGALAAHRDGGEDPLSGVLRTLAATARPPAGETPSELRREHEWGVMAQ